MTGRVGVAGAAGTPNGDAWVSRWVAASLCPAAPTDQGQRDLRALAAPAGRAVLRADRSGALLPPPEAATADGFPAAKAWRAGVPG